MAPSTRALPVATLILRLLTLSLLVASLVLVATDRAYYDSLLVRGRRIPIRPVNFDFKDRYVYRYVLSVAAIGCAYTLLLIPFAVITIVRPKVIGGNGVAVMFLIFTDVVFCALFATRGVAGLGFTVDSHRSYQDDFGSDLKKFFRSVDASCALLLAAAVCMVIMVMISVYSK